MRSVVLVGLAVMACGRQQHRQSSPGAPITADEASAFAKKFRDAAMPCNAAHVDELVDRDAFHERVKRAAVAPGTGASELFETGTGTSFLASKLCAWLGSVHDYKFLHVRDVHGELHPIFRRGSAGASYHELLLTRAEDGGARVADVYSYYTGEWISDEAALADTASGHDDDLANGITLVRIRQLETQNPSAALAALDHLPPRIRDSRFGELWRVSLAQKVSQEAYKAALDEVSQRFPDDPAAALVEIDGAYLRGDLTGALHDVDLVDAAVGPDAFLDGVRASLLVARGQPGDLDAAEAASNRASSAEPDAQVVIAAKLAVALGRKQWPVALGVMDDLSKRFGARFDEPTMSSMPMFAELLRSSEYAAWRERKSGR